MSLMTDVNLNFHWQEYRQGLFIIKYDFKTWDPDPYANSIYILVDIVYALMVLKMLYAESKELIPAMKNGIDGFFDYWEFWNAVDWISITTGFALIWLWYYMYDLTQTSFR